LQWRWGVLCMWCVYMTSWLQQWQLVWKHPGSSLLCELWAIILQAVQSWVRGGKSSQKAELAYALHTIETCSRAHTLGPDWPTLSETVLSGWCKENEDCPLLWAAVQSPCLFRPLCVPKEKNEGCPSPRTRPPCSFSFSPSEMSVIVTSVFHRPLRHSCQQPLITRTPTASSLRSRGPDGPLWTGASSRSPGPLSTLEVQIWARSLPSSVWPDGQRAAGGSCVHSFVQESVGKGRGAVGKAHLPDLELNASSFTHICGLGKSCKSVRLWCSLLSGEGTHLLIQGQSVLRCPLWCVSGSPGIQCLEQKL
jgi:hypothetical protein